MEFDEDYDTHICLSCHMTLIGLDNYVTHKKTQCPARKSAGGKGKSCGIPPPQTTPEGNCLVSVADTVGPLVSSSFSPNASISNRIVDPNMVLLEGTSSSNRDASISDFFSSLELQSRGSAEPAGHQHDQGLNRAIGDGHKDGELQDLGKADTAENIEDEHQKALRIASILNELEFSSDSDFMPSGAENILDGLTDEDDFDDVLSGAHPPGSHTGGKWKPGAYSTKGQSRGKWRPGEKKFPGKYHREEDAEHESTCTKTSGKLWPSVGKKWPVEHIEDTPSSLGGGKRHPGHSEGSGGGKKILEYSSSEGKKLPEEGASGGKRWPVVGTPTGHSTGGKKWLSDGSDGRRWSGDQGEKNSAELTSTLDCINSSQTSREPAGKKFPYDVSYVPENADLEQEELIPREGMVSEKQPYSQTGGKCWPGDAAPVDDSLKEWPEDVEADRNHTGGKWKAGHGPAYSVHQWTREAKNNNANEDDRESDDADIESGSNGPEEDEGAACSDTEKGYHCSSCNRTLKSIESYQRHCSTVYHKKRIYSHPHAGDQHEGDQIKDPIKCPVCNKNFSHKYNFARHLISSYHQKRATNGVPFVLDETNQLLLLRQSPFQCQICQFYCHTREDLNQHMKRSDHADRCHELLGPMLCVRCHYRCRCNEDMLQHISSTEHIDTITKIERPCIIKEARKAVKCTICNKVEHSATRLRRHMQLYHESEVNMSRRPCRGRPKVNRVCSFCNKKFPSAFGLAIHIRRNHTKERPFKCVECDKLFLAKSDLNKHIVSARHLNQVLALSSGSPAPRHRDIELASMKRKEKMYACHFNGCSFKSRSFTDMRPHYKKEHADPELHCAACGTQACNERSFQNHKETSVHKKNAELAAEGKQSFTCPTCQRKFYDSRKAQFHELTHKYQITEAGLARGNQRFAGVKQKHHKFLQGLKDKRRVDCPECGKNINTKNMTSHLRTHEGTNPFQCMYCESRFSCSLLLRRHIMAHLGLKEYKCDVCGKEFARPHHLVRHMVTHKSGKDIGSVPCEFCGKRFHYLWQVNAHVARCHREKTFVCSHEGCRAKFNHKSELLYHTRIHTDERPFLCDKCGYAGRSQQLLTRHRRTHTGERKYPCDYCNYRGSNSTQLRRHMRIHIGSKPFKCPYCDYACNTHENLRKHIKNTNKHQGLPIYPCGKCSFGSDKIKDYTNHLEKVHDIDPKSIDIFTAYAGIYIKSQDIRELPEGACAILPQKLRVDASASGSKKRQRKVKTPSGKDHNQVDHAYISSAVATLDDKPPAGTGQDEHGVTVAQLVSRVQNSKLQENAVESSGAFTTFSTNQVNVVQLVEVQHVERNTSDTGHSFSDFHRNSASGTVSSNPGYHGNSDYQGYSAGLVHAHDMHGEHAHESHSQHDQGFLGQNQGPTASQYDEIYTLENSNSLQQVQAGHEQCETSNNDNSLAESQIELQTVQCDSTGEGWSYAEQEHYRNRYVGPNWIMSFPNDKSMVKLELEVETE